ncbi:MAG: ComEC/Rec2 family competence protein [Acutalibacteraceae bacterium]
MFIVLLALLLVFLIPAGIFILFPEYRIRANRNNIEVQDAALGGGTDRIHFLNTGSSDAILLESDGHFALVDAGEDSDNPRGFDSLNLTGYEDKVVAYLKQNAAGEDGTVHLDFVLGTHSHSDHIGGFDTVIADSEIVIDRAYLKVYDSSKIKDSEVQNWDNQEVYDQMVSALEGKNVPIVSQPDSEPFPLGNFTVTIFNGIDEPTDGKVGENDQSMGVLVEKDGTRIFLAGDIDNISGDETRLAEQIGDVHLLKVGHHGYPLSSSRNWLKTLSPEYCVITNNRNIKNVLILWRIARCVNSTILTTNEEDGVLAEIGSSGQISFYNSIHA